MPTPVQRIDRRLGKSVADWGRRPEAEDGHSGKGSRPPDEDLRHRALKRIKAKLASGGE